VATTQNGRRPAGRPARRPAARRVHAKAGVDDADRGGRHAGQPRSLGNGLDVDAEELPVVAEEL
jgi:hypothetical protein